MRRYIGRRLLLLPPILALVSLGSFFLIHLSPGDPARIFLSQGGDAPSEAAVAALREQLGLNAPILQQYITWLVGALRGDLGASISTGRPVAAELLRSFPATLKLTALAMLLTLAVSIPLGALAASRENRPADNLIRAVSFVTGSLPGFFAALLLIYLFGVRLRWLPTISTGSPKGILLPALALALTLSAGYIRQVRGALVKELGEEYIRMARARGIREGMILYGGALRSALPTILTVAGVNIGHLLGGTAIIETVCTYPGIGRMAVGAVLHRDYPMVQGYALLMAVVYVLVNLLVDLLHGLADPRIRRGLAAGERAEAFHGRAG